MPLRFGAHGFQRAAALPLPNPPGAVDRAGPAGAIVPGREAGRETGVPLGPEDHFVHAGDVVVDPVGDDEEGEAGGDDETEAVPGFVHEDGGQAEADVEEGKGEAGEEDAALVVEIEQNGKEGEETDEEESAKEGDLEDAGLDRADAGEGGDRVGEDDEEGGDKALDFEKLGEAGAEGEDDGGLGGLDLLEGAAVFDGGEEGGVFPGEVGFELEEEDRHAGDDAEEAEIDGGVVLRGGVEQAAGDDLLAAAGEPPKDELIRPDAEAVEESTKGEGREAAEVMKEVPGAVGSGAGAAEFPVQAADEPDEEESMTSDESWQDCGGSQPVRPGPGEKAGAGVTDGEAEDHGLVVLQGIEVVGDDENAGDEDQQGGGADLIEKISRNGEVEEESPHDGGEQGGEGEGSVAGGEDAIP